MPSGPVTLQSYYPVLVALGAHLIQGLYYYPRLPREVAYKYDFSLEPRLWCSKGGFFALVGLPVCLVAAMPLVVGAPVVWPISVALVLIAVVDQYVFAANMREGRLHSSLWFVLPAILVGGIWLMSRQLPG